MLKQRLVHTILTLAASTALIPQAQAACSNADELKISAIGDILVHGAIYEPANESRQSFASIWKTLEPLFEAADVSYGNLEGSAAAGVTQSQRVVRDPGRVYDCDHPNGDTQRNGSNAVYCSTNFLFNYHPDIVRSLKGSGIDVLSTANNHSFDRGRIGIDKTIEAMQEIGMPFTGTRHSSQQNEFYTITRQKGWKVAWIGCTDVANWASKQSQVLMCKSETTMGLISSLSSRSDIDAVIVTPHWGDEYQTSQNGSQTALAQRMAEAGATAIIGSHPHVLQPVKVLKTSKGREVPVAYSLGNFIAGQRALERKLSVVLFLTLKRGGGQARVTDLATVPIIRVGVNVRTVDDAQRSGQMAGEEREVANILRSRMSATRVIRPSQVCE